MGRPAMSITVGSTFVILITVFAFAAWWIQTSGVNVNLDVLGLRGDWLSLRGDSLSQATQDLSQSDVRSYIGRLEAAMLLLNETDLAAKTTGDREAHERYREFNYKALSNKVQICELRPKDCSNDTVIVSGGNFWWALFDNSGEIRITSGESTIVTSLLSALQSLQVLVLFAQEEADALFFSKSLHPYVKVTFAGNGLVKEAVYNGDQRNLPMEDYDSIPYIYQGKFETCNVLILDFWGRGPNPSAPKDNVTTYLQVLTPYSVHVGNSFVGFSPREDCSSTFVPFEKRKSAGLLWGKRSSYLSDSWTPATLESVLKSGLVNQVLATAVVDPQHPFPASVTNLGLQNVDGFQEVLGTSQFLLGLGHPRNGPTLLEALCRGTPYINPVFDGPLQDLEFDRPIRKPLPFEGPSDFAPNFLKDPQMSSGSAIAEKYGSRYSSQHSFAETLGPPYVYHVELNNVEQLLGAIKAIQSNTGTPTGAFVPEQYTRLNLVQRVQKIVRHPWCSWVSDPLAARGRGRAEALFPFA